MQAVKAIRDNLYDDKVDHFKRAHEVRDSVTRTDMVNIFD